MSNIGLNNEQLAEQIKSGRTWLLPVLWEGIEKLIIKQANTYYTGRLEACREAGITKEDLLQSGYFAMLDSIEAYKGEYKFNTYLAYHLLNQFNSAAGLRTVKGKKDPMRAALSLDMPTTFEDDSLTLADSIADPIGQEGLEAIEKQDLIERLHETLEDCLEKLPATEGDAIRSRYYKNQSFKEIAQEQGIKEEKARRLIGNGLKRLRRYPYNKRLREYKEELIGAYSLRNTGLASFRSTWTSATERAVIEIDYWEQRERGYLADNNVKTTSPLIKGSN